MLLLVVLSLVVALAALVLALRPVLAARASGAAAPDDLPEDVVGLRQEVAALRAEARGALRHLAVVRYDAFGQGVGSSGEAGRLSWSVALVDDTGAGVVLTSITGRSEVRSYAKALSGWSAEQPLSPEEAEAVGLARSS